ncbi:hypothetical protein EDB82DRAFT_549756 [Fusarium venenatum]|uniref:uncharacterized protein n=1 Tax=Fusarium venenatum TaxID=56646 RepID=UPI001DFA59BB|nr:hypothetical protein EDB82DRAFT_549756 [Fusarium venenatum]
MHLHSLEGELRSTENSFKPTPQEETEAENIALELRTSQSLDAICTNILDCKSAAKLAKNANRDKSLHHFDVGHMAQNPRRFEFMNESIRRKARSTLDAAKPQASIRDRSRQSRRRIHCVSGPKNCANITNNYATAELAKNANRDKFLHQFAIDSLLNHEERHPCLQDSVDRIRNGDVLSEEQYALFKQQIKTLYRDTIREFSSVVVTIPVITPLRLRETPA